MFFMTPSGSVKFPIFTPLAGFNSITTPEIEQEFEEIREGNSKYIKYFPLNKVSISPIIIIRGVSVFESAFYRWIKKGITFDDPRRHLLLVHYTNINFLGAFGVGQREIPFVGVGVEQITTLPGKAWLLYDCLPKRYKAATDFDATSSDISLTEIEIQPERIEEFALTAGR